MAKVKQPETLEDAIRGLGERLIASSKLTNIYGYQPHDKQLPFHKSTAKRRLYIGGNRSGKTTGGICEDVWYATGTHPYKDTPATPIRGRIVTTDLTEGILKNIIPQLQRWCPVSALRGGSWTTAYDKQERTLYFENESFIEILSYEQSLNKFASVSRHFIHFDEEPPKDIFNECMARLVDTGGDAWVTMTPVDGMTWVYDAMYLPGLDPDNLQIAVIQVDMQENPYLGANEIEDFLSTLDDDERLAREHGKFIQLGGVIYKYFNSKTHVIEPWHPPRDTSWEVSTSLDHGFNAPTAMLWHAVSPDLQVITFHEHYASGMTIDEHAKKFHEINKELGVSPMINVADPSIRNTDPITGTSIHEEYLKYGVPYVLGNNDVRAGIVKVARYLKMSPAGRPNLLVTKDCPNLIKEFPRYRWKTYASKRIQEQNNAQDVPHKKDDHALDSQRYFIMSRPDLGPLSDEAEAITDNPLGMPKSYSPYGPNQRVAEPMHRDSSFDEYSGDTKWDEYDESMGGVY